MANKLIAIYRKPDDEAAFNAHYENVHTPLVRKIPGLQSVTVNRMKRHLMGDDQPYMIVEMAFPDTETFKVAMASEENQATGKDLANFAKGLVSVMTAES